MKMKLLLLALAISFTVSGQERIVEHPGLSVGTEADILPYATGGYYGSLWVAENHFRYRAVVTRVTLPEFITPTGFTNNRMMVYAALADYFFSKSIESWWVGGGFEYWDATIQTDEQRATAAYKSYVATVGGGYVWKCYRNFYLNPWVAIHARIAGDLNVAVEGRSYTPPVFTPEGSLKVGWYFKAGK